MDSAKSNVFWQNAHIDFYKKLKFPCFGDVFTRRRRWLTAMKNKPVRAVVAYEPGSGFVFPERELPEPIPNASFFGALKANEVPLEQFTALTRITIITPEDASEDSPKRG